MLSVQKFDCRNVIFRLYSMIVDEFDFEYSYLGEFILHLISVVRVNDIIVWRELDMICSVLFFQ